MAPNMGKWEDKGEGGDVWKEEEDKMNGDGKMGYISGGKQMLYIKRYGVKNNAL